jgi:class 3 adenylate cyclase/tetratricopeptide (TPR) repeat protein
VLFCDLVGSTSLSQQLDAEEWRDLIAQYQQAASGAVARFGGHVARKLGDGLLIYFGWPTAREDDPERAVRAGLAIVDALGPLNATLAAEDGPRLAVRIGLHTGPVVIADDGEVFGETANVAAHVQGAAEPDTVVVTAATQRLVAGMFVVEDRGPQMVKGVREPLTLYRVVHPSGVRSRLAVAEGRLTRFVGREGELATLLERWARARDGEGQTVVVFGEAGVGKSRLVYQFHEHLTAVPHTWLECGATPYTEGTPFHPVIALVAQGLALAPGDTAAEQLGKLEVGLRTLASAETVALLADFLGLPPPTPLQMSPELQRRKTIDLLAQWTLSLSAVQPLVVVVEDLHWCDASTLELLGTLIAQSATARVLLLATARPEFTPPWPTNSNLTTVQLPRLTTLQACDMVTALGGPELATATRDALVARADGVPLYIEELTKAVVEPGMARGVEAIPATLADSLMARLDRLSTAKDVAQRAAVLGREFGYPLLAATAGLDEAALRHGLARLIDAEILFACGAPPAATATYIFKHALIQETAYQSLLKRTRQRLHGRVVDVLVAAFPERAAAEPEVVARHAEVAGRIDDAIAFYQRAAERAQARSAQEEAIRHLRHAITLLAPQPDSRERDARETALQLALGGSLMAARGYTHPEVEVAYERARVLCEAVGDARWLGFALSGLATFCHNYGQIERARALAVRVLAIAEQTGDEELALKGHLDVAAAELYQGKFASSLAHCEAVRTLYEPGRHYPVVFMLIGGLGVSALVWAAWDLWALGWPDRALARAREASVLARQLSHPFSLAFALFFETVLHWLRRDVTAQRERAAETIALSEAQGFPIWLAVGRTFHAAARVAAGEPEAVADVLAGLALSTDAGNQGGVPALFALLGEVYTAAGQIAEARAAVETGLAVTAQTGQPFFAAELYRLQGQILTAQVRTIANGSLVPVGEGQGAGRVAGPVGASPHPTPLPEGKGVGMAFPQGDGAEGRAEECFHRALCIARAQAAKSFELRAATSLARLRQRQGKRAEARALLAPVYEWFTEGFDTRDLVEAKALLDELS